LVVEGCYKIREKQYSVRLHHELIRLDQQAVGDCIQCESVRARNQSIGIYSKTIAVDPEAICIEAKSVAIYTASQGIARYSDRWGRQHLPANCSVLGCPRAVYDL